MQATTIMNRYLVARYAFFKWRYSLTLVNKLILALAMAFLTGLTAQIRIYLPFSPVPVTGQVFAVLLSGVICGGVFGSLSQLIYIGLGIAGLSWFAAFSPASAHLFASATGGYLIGFVIAPLLIGGYTDRYIGARAFFSQIKLMMLGVGVIYVSGAVVLALVMKLTFWQTMLQGVIPFILIDLIKAALAASISSAILPRSSYNGEIDKRQ
ncbi:MAG: biotin transporter BioY [Candidatus Omnitrophota bacterium]|jgi:biotin transport system substrate-specific component